MKKIIDCTLRDGGYNTKWNFNKDFSNDALKKNAFEIKRAYFGYEYKISEKISSKVTFDVGKNNSGSDYTAFLKIAQLDWKVKNNFKLSLGMIGNKQFKYQDSIWGYRYMYKTFQDLLVQQKKLIVLCLKQLVIMTPT